MLHLTKLFSFLARCHTCDAYGIFSAGLVDAKASNTAAIQARKYAHAFCQTLQLYCIPDDELTHGGSPAVGQVGGQLDFFTSTGHSAAVPVQDSGMSQTPAAALQTAVGPL
jgi:hypothetical protein